MWEEARTSGLTVSLTVAVNFAIAVIIGFLVGSVLDDHLNTGWLAYAGALGGLASGIPGLYLMARSRTIAEFSTVGLSLVLLVTVGMALGHTLDDRLATSPRWMLVGMVVTVSMGLLVMRERSRMQRQSRRRLQLLYSVSAGLYFFGAVVGGILAGRIFDDHFATAPMLTAVGSVAGVLIGFRIIYRLLLED